MIGKQRKIILIVLLFLSPVFVRRDLATTAAGSNPPSDVPRSLPGVTLLSYLDNGDIWLVDLHGQSRWRVTEGNR